MTNLEKRITNALKTLVTGMSKHPGDVRVEVDEMDSAVTVQMWVNRADMGFVVGTRGANLARLEELLSVIGCIERKSTMRLRLNEPITGNRGEVVQFRKMMDFDPEPWRAALQTIANDILDLPVSVGWDATGQISTTYKILIPGNVDPLHTRMKDVLNDIMHAVGKNNGRLFHVEVKHTGEAVQPKSADGRFAPAA